MNFSFFEAASSSESLCFNINATITLERAHIYELYSSKIKIQHCYQSGDLISVSSFGIC